MRAVVVMAVPPWEKLAAYEQARHNLCDNIPRQQINAMKAFHFLEESLQRMTKADHVLFAWMPDGLEIAEKAMSYLISLGYTYHAKFIWAGADQNMTLLYKGRFLPYRVDPGMPVTAVFSGNPNGSRKPASAYRLIGSLYPHYDKLQLFGSTSRPGWHLFRLNGP